MSREKEVRSKSGPSIGIAGDIEKDGTASYIASAQVTDFNNAPKDMVTGTVPAGTYAEFKHIGPISTFGKTVTYIHGTWLPKSGYKNSGRMVEIYPQGANVHAENFEMKVLIPIPK
jgi:predicted transcriptional regulator YdeE